MRFKENKNFNEQQFFEEQLKKYQLKKEREEKIIMEIRSNSNYLEEINPEDYNSFEILFNLIDNYAKENNISPITNSFGFLYIIKNNDTYYFIGNYYKLGNPIVLGKIPKEFENQIDTFIEFKDIQSNKVKTLNKY